MWNYSINKCELNHRIIVLYNISTLVSFKIRIIEFLKKLESRYHELNAVKYSSIPKSNKKMFYSFMNCKTNLFNQIEFSPTEKSSLKFTFHLKSFHRKFQHPKLSLVVNNVHPVLYFSFLRLGLWEHWCGTNWNHFS